MSVIALHEDDEKGLWVSTFTSITRVELGAPFTVFDPRTGLPDGITFDLFRHRGEFYLTYDGRPSRLEPAQSGESAHFVAIDAVPADVRLQGSLSH